MYVRMNECLVESTVNWITVDSLESLSSSFDVGRVFKITEGEKPPQAKKVGFVGATHYYYIDADGYLMQLPNDIVEAAMRAEGVTRENLLSRVLETMQSNQPLEEKYPVLDILVSAPVHSEVEPPLPAYMLEAAVSKPAPMQNAAINHNAPKPVAPRSHEELHHSSTFSNMVSGISVAVGATMMVAGVAACLTGVGISVGAFLLTMGKAILGGFMAFGLSTVAATAASGLYAAAGAGFLAFGLFGLFKSKPRSKDDEKPENVHGSRPLMA